MRHLALDHAAHGRLAIVRQTPEVDAYRSGVCLRQDGKLGPRRHAYAPVGEELIGETDAPRVDDLPSSKGAKHPDVSVPAGNRGRLVTGDHLLELVIRSGGHQDLIVTAR